MLCLECASIEGKWDFLNSNVLWISLSAANQWFISEIH